MHVETQMKNLQNSEKRYRRLFEASKDGILILDAETGKVEDVNPFLLELLGYSYDELCGQYIWDIGVFKDIAASKDAFKTLQNEKYIQYDDLPLETRDGLPIAVEFVSNLYLVDDLKVIQCNIRDITERKRIEEQLRLSDVTYRGILDSITEAVFILDAGGVFVDMNAVTEKMYGHAASEFIGRTLECISAPGKNDLAQLDAYRDLAFHGKHQLFDHWGLRKDGTIFPQYVSFSFGYYFGKKVIIAVARDITERKRLETEIQDAREYAENIVETVRESLVVLNSELKILTANNSFYATFRVTPAETIGQFIYDLGNRQWDIPKLRVLFEEILPKITVFNNYEVEHDFLDIGRKTILLNARGIYRESIASHVILLAMEDITERKRTEQILRDVQRRESIGIFSAGIAHDFNNMLGVMMGNVTLVQSQLPPHHPVQKNIEKTLTAMKRTAGLTNQILAYSGAGKSETLTINIGEIVEEHVSLFTATLPKNVKLVLHLPSPPVYMVGDPGQIKQIIMNLITNGGEAIRNKQGIVSIRLDEIELEADDVIDYGRLTNNILRAGRYAVLEVSDSGSGMSRDTVNKIFDPFFTTKFTGRGLGLSAVLGIIRGHEGGIRIETDERSGTTFRVILPASSPPEPGLVPPRQADLHEVHHKMSILVIDDEQDVAEVAQEILETENFTVLVELNPIQGIERYKLHQNEIGVVLLDLTMPEMSGADVVDALRAMNPDVKIIISSGYSEQDVQKKVAVSKVAGFLHKPYPMQALLTIVNTVLQQDESMESVLDMEG
jgi:two-component system, cell cycle sensor histidine kinase and response regulator CckA